MLINKTHRGVSYYKATFDYTCSVERINTYLDNLHPYEIMLLQTFVTEDGLVMFNANDCSQKASFSTCKINGQEVPVIKCNVHEDSPKSGLVAHEYTHYLQYKRGDISFTHDVNGLEDKVFWKGVPVEKWNTACPNSYINSPWEQEAHNAEFMFRHAMGLTTRTPERAMTLCRLDRRIKSFLVKTGLFA